jgi:D-aspartate ligase
LYFAYFIFPIFIVRLSVLDERAPPRVEGRMMSRSPPGFVLTMAGYYGTVAAARCLGDHDVPVMMLDAERLVPGLWSRSVVWRERCPPPRPIERFIEWLLQLGARDPGHVLYPTCDDLAWAFAEYQAELSRYFRLSTPPFASVARVLDKRELYAACDANQIHTPLTWFPRDDDELDRAGREARFPLIVKPRTQVRFTTMRKGKIVASHAELREAYGAFVRCNPYDQSLLERHAHVERPMVQEFCAAAGQPIYSVTGFCDARHELFVARGMHKLVQWPRLAGIGIYFEGAELDEALAEHVRRLCRATGVFGVFEAEFATGTGEPLLIDFNPRFFGQMGFDVARGLPSPYLAYLEAIGDRSRLRAEVDAARAWRPADPTCFVNGTALAWTSMVERLVGHIPAPSVASLCRSGKARRVFDAVKDPRDWVPGVVDDIQQIAGALRHPRATLRAAASGM